MADSRYIIELILQARDQTGTAFQSMIKNQENLSRLQQQSIDDNQKLAKTVDDLDKSFSDFDQTQKDLKKTYSDVRGLTAATAKEQVELTKATKEYVRVSKDEQASVAEKIAALEQVAEAQENLASAQNKVSKGRIDDAREAAKQLRISVAEEESLRARTEKTRQLAEVQSILIDQVEQLSDATKRTGQDNKEAIESFRQQFIAAKGDVEEFNKAIERGSKANKKDLEDLSQSALKYADIQRSIKRLEEEKSRLGDSPGDRTVASEIDIKVGNLNEELERVKQEGESIIKFELPAELDNASVAKLIASAKTIFTSESFDVEAEADLASFAKVEAEKRVLSRDVKFDVEPKADLVSLKGFVGGFWTAFNEGSEKASQNVAAFDNIIRGALALGIAVFLEQLAIAAIGAASALAALVSSAISAGAALGGALAAGAAQAAPAIAVLGTFASRVGNVFQAVKQANLLQQQESYKGGQAAVKQASQLGQVVTAQERVKDAQEKVTEARKKAREELEKLILSERKQNLTVERAQEQLRSALSGGGSFAVEEARIGLEEAQNNLRSTRSDLRSRQRAGIEGSPEVTEATKNLAEARRGLEQARQSATQAGASVDATTGKLNFLIENLSSAERRLYRALVDLQNNFQNFARNISEPLINAFTFAVRRINQILGSSAIVNAAKGLSESLAGAFREVFDFALSDGVINRILGFAREFQNNLAPLVNIAKNLLSIFLDFAEAGAPALAILVRYFDDLIQSLADFTGSVSGKNALTDFFTEGTESVKGFVEVFKAFGNLVLAIIGPGGGIDAGNTILEQLTNTFNDLADGIRDPDSRIAQFTKRFFDFAKQIGPIFKPLLVAIADLIDNLFTERGINSLRNFIFLVSDVAVPAFEAFLKAITFLTDGFAELVRELPLVQKALELVIFGALAGSVVGRIGGLFKPVTETFKFLKTFAGDLTKAYGGATRQINKTADALKALQKTQAAGEVLDTAGNLNDVPIRDTRRPVSPGAFPGAPLPLPASRTGSLNRRLAPTASKLSGSRLVGRIPGAASFFGGAAVAAGTLPAAGAPAGAAAGAGGFLGPAAAVAAPIIAIVAALTALLAISGKLDDVWKAIKETADGVFASISDAVGELAKELTGENSAKKAFDALLVGAKALGTALSAVLIPAIKIVGVIIGVTVVRAINGFTALVRFVRALARSFINAFNGIKEIFIGIFTLDASRILGGIGKIGEAFLSYFKGVGRLLLDVLTLPFRSLASVVGKIFPEVGRKIEGVFASVINFFIKGINGAISLINKLPGVEIKEIELVRTPEEQERADRQQRTSATRDLRQASGPSRSRVLAQSRDRRQFRREQRAAGRGTGTESAGRDQRTTEATNENSEKFLNSFNPETVKLSEKIRDKLADYWSSLRRQARRTVVSVVQSLREIRKDGGRAIDQFVKGARADVVSLNVAFRTRFVNISNIVRNQMLKVSNIVRNQMQVAKKAVYDGAKYMTNALNEALDSVGSKSKVTLNLQPPKLEGRGGAETKAVGGWIGNRGERGRDMVPTLLGRGEAVLNWQQQNVVEPALRQTYGFGLDDMFARTKGYHAGGPSEPGLAKGGRGKLFRSGRASWFGGPNDAMNVGTALGLPDTVPGIALLNQGTLGKYFNVYSPQGRWRKLRQVDIGPATWTGKILDITSAALKYFGFNEKNFPTGKGIWKVYGPVGKGGDVGGSGSGTGGTMADIVMPKIRGGSEAMRELVTKNVKKMVDAANEKLERTAPPPSSGGGINVPRGKVSGNLNEARKMAERMGLVVSSFMRPNDLDSFHSQGRALDLSGSPAAMARFFRWALKRYGRRLTELFYDPLGGIDNGRSIGAIGGHTDHVHIAFNKGGRVTEDVLRRREMEARKNKLGGMKQYAAGGAIGGPEGQPVPIMAHAGEWVLNRRQQKMVSAATGMSPDRLKGMLGFSGGPTSFAGGGEVKETEAFSFLPTTINTSRKVFDEQLDKFGKAVNKLLENVLTTTKLKREREKLEKQIATLKKGGTTDKEQKTIDDLETRLKNIDRTSAVDKLLKSVRALTGIDGEGGTLGTFLKGIERSFADVSSKISLGAAGLERSARKVGERIKPITDIFRLQEKTDPAKIAAQQAEAQEKLRDGLIEAVDQYAIQIARLRKAANRIGSRTRGKGKDKERVNVSLDRLEKEQDRDQKELEKLEDVEKPDKKQKDRIKTLKERTDRRKKDIEARGKLESEIELLEGKRLDSEQKVIEAENARVEALKEGIAAGLKNATRAADLQAKNADFRKSLGEVLLTTGGVVSDNLAGFGAGVGAEGQTLIDNAVAESAQAAASKRDQIKLALAVAKNAYGNDPRFQETIDDLEDQLRDASLAAAQAASEVTANSINRIQTGLENATKQIDFDSAISSAQKSFAELVGNTSGVDTANQQTIEFARRRYQAIQDALRDAQAQDQSDPRVRDLVNSLKQQAEESSLAIAQAQADLISGRIAAIDEAFQRGETRRGLSDRLANIADRVTANGGNARRLANIQERGTDLQTQRSALQALLSDPNIQGNARQMQELTDRLADLDVTIAENTQELNDLRLQIRQQAIERITGVSTRTGGLLGNVESIFGNIARLTGQPNTRNQISVAESLRTALGLENTNLAAELNSFLTDPQSSGLLGPEATGVLQQLLTSFSTGDPTSFATTLQSLAPQIALLESTLGESARGPFSAFIDSLVNNTIAISDNTANLAELNGLANQPQEFQTQAWTRFRAAIFNGIGDVLPQFQVPQMATGGYITKGGMFELHPGEFVVNANQSNVPDSGDINITVNEANKPLDVTALASRIAFEKRTRK